VLFEPSYGIQNTVIRVEYPDDCCKGHQNNLPAKVKKFDNLQFWYRQASLCNGQYLICCVHYNWCGTVSCVDIVSVVGKCLASIFCQIGKLSSNWQKFILSIVA